jgi:hypothetical protein
MAKISWRSINVGAFCIIALLFTNYLNGGYDMRQRLRKFPGLRVQEAKLVSRIFGGLNASSGSNDSTASWDVRPKRERIKSKLEEEAARRGQKRDQTTGGVREEMSPYEAIEMRKKMLFEEVSEELSKEHVHASTAYQPPQLEHLVVQHSSGRDGFLKETTLGARPGHSARCVEVHGDGFDKDVKPPKGWPDQCTALVLVSSAGSGEAKKGVKGGGDAGTSGGIDDLRALLSGNVSITLDTRVFGPFDAETALGAVGDGVLDAVYLRMSGNDCDAQQTVFAWRSKLDRTVGVMIGEEFKVSVPAPTPRRTRAKACLAWKLGNATVKTAAEDLALMEGTNVLVSAEDDKPMWAVEMTGAEARHGMVVEKPYEVRGRTRRGVAGGVEPTEKILHFVWTSVGLEGDQQPPEWVWKNILAWRALQTKHSWEIRLWNNALVRKELAPFDEAMSKAPNAASIANLVRYAAIYLYGGVYIDVDTVPVRPIENLVEAFSPFGVCEKFVSMPGLLRATRCLYMTNAVIAAPAGHEALRRAYQRASRNIKSKEGAKMNQLLRSGVKLWTIAAWEDDIEPKVTALGSSTFMPCTWKEAAAGKCWGNETTYRSIEGVYGHHTSVHSWGKKGSGAAANHSNLRQ